jgi:hypothetical protein
MLTLTQGRIELTAYQRALWGHASALWPLTGDAPGPCLSNLGMHLPPSAARTLYQAASAHAGAHLVYSRERFDAKSLKPITRALVGLLEDARVEWLACRELPGLRALWLPFHEGAVDAGHDFEALMRRLARVLLAPSHDDPHPWVQKGRALFFEDAEGRSLRLRRASDIRLAASRLGHDIGQMRLSLNPRLYVVQPAYRDDHACLWQDEGKAREQVMPSPADDETPGGTPQPAQAEPTTTLHRYPEWDRLIRRHRLDWCTVHEWGPRTGLPRDRDLAPPQSARASPWDWEARTMERLSRQWEGEFIDLDAAVQARADQRAGRMPDGRIHTLLRPRPQASALLCLIDLSASCHEGQIDAARRLALAAAAAVARTQAGASAIAGFRSFGRHELRFECLKDFGEALNAAALQGLQGAGSTRLGAAIRHATRRLLQRPEPQRRLLVFTDGEAYDIDVHDPHYLVEDARQAAAEARRRGVTVIGCGRHGADAIGLRRVFGGAVRLFR